MKLTISSKLLIGYLCMALLTVLASAYAVINLQKLNQVAYDLTSRNFILLETAKSMMDALLAQESAEKKYFIFKDASVEQIFWQRSSDFKSGLETIRKLSKGPDTQKILDRLDDEHDEYGAYFTKEAALLKEGRKKEAAVISDSTGKGTIENIARQLKDIQLKTDKEISDKMNNIATQSSNAVNMTLGLCLLSLVVGITLALIITRNISKPLRHLQQATGSIAEGKLDYQVQVRRDDEIGALAKSFAYMIKRLKVLEAMNLDASPLTGLPGNLAIEKKIKEMLGSGKLFSLCQVDLDNFKPFADKYGYAWGSEVIKEVADILNGYVAENQAEEIFIGHIGGDDFVVIAKPEQTRKICQQLVADFSKNILNYFDARDAQNGYIIGKNRQGVTHKFPLITVSAAIVTDDGSRFKNPLDMAMTVAELKEYAKLLPGSNYVTQEDLERHNNLYPQEQQSELELENC